MGSDGPADSAGVDQPQAQGPPGRWTQLWAYPQVRENLSSRGGALASGTCRGGPARDSEGAEARGRRVALWGLKDLALLLGYRQVALVSSGGLRGWRRDTVPEPQSEQWWVGGEGGKRREVPGGSAFSNWWPGGHGGCSRTRDDKRG